MARSPHIINRLHGQRGGVAIWFALCLPVLLGFAALAVDLARLNLIRVELQNAADAAALAGARALSDSGGQPYNWQAAHDWALSVAQRNYANGAQIQSTQIICEPTPYYWHLPHGTVPAIKVTVTMPLKLFFAPIWGVNQKSVQASATAMIAPPASGTGMTPFVINKIMFDNYWDSANHCPVYENGKPKELIIGIGSTYFGTAIDSGTWTTFNNQTNSINANAYIVELINGGGNTAALSIGDSIWIASGAKESAYSALFAKAANTDVSIIVVQSVQEGSWQPIYAIAGFHIDKVLVAKEKINGKPYVQGHFIDPTTIPGTDPGTGNGRQYGALTPPALVE